MASAPQAEILPPEDLGPLPPMAAPVILYGERIAAVPHAFRGGNVLQPVRRGIGVAWTPVLEIGQVLLSIAGGNPEQPSDDMIVATMSRAGLRGLIKDLQSIDEQLGEAW